MTEEEHKIKMLKLWDEYSKYTWEEIAKEFNISQKTLKAIILNNVIWDSINEMINDMKELGWIDK